MMQNLFIALICSLLFPLVGSAQVEKVIVETYYVSNATDATDTSGGKLVEGSKTYRVYIDLKPGNKLRKIYGDKNHALKFFSTQPFFNNIDGETYGKDLKRVLYNFNTFALDSWLTIGQATAKTPANTANFGVLKNQDNNGSFIGGPNNDGGSAEVAGGLLTNTDTNVGIPITTADGMFIQNIPNYLWTTNGIKDLLTNKDTSIFGSLVSKNIFASNETTLDVKPGVSGVNLDSNQILVAQLTTKGELSFELNIEVEQLVDTSFVIFKYVANGDILLTGENVENKLKYPFIPNCGCQDIRYLEYSRKYECSDPSRCINLVVFGCKDSLACNFDPNANFSTPVLCCYPGLCQQRDISVVCPEMRGPYAEINVFPNPAEDILYLDVLRGIEEKVSFSIYDYSGTAVLENDLGSYQRLVNHEINISSLNKGLYMIKVSVGTEVFYNRFIKD
jgi:Secretion system C-terminal sorting domain